MKSKIHHLDKTFVILDPQQRAHPKDVTDTLYQELDSEFNHFKGHSLVAVYEFKQDWPTWEIHPAGDEIVYLVEGQADMILMVDGDQQIVRLDSPGSFVIIPKNTWHTARVISACKMLFITPGEGTENKAHPEPADLSS